MAVKINNYHIGGLELTVKYAARLDGKHITGAIRGAGAPISKYGLSQLRQPHITFVRLLFYVVIFTHKIANSPLFLCIWLWYWPSRIHFQLWVFTNNANQHRSFCIFTHLP